MLSSMRILLLSGISLLPAFALAATPDARKDVAADTLGAAIEACDNGAAVPLDPQAKAPPVQFGELLSHNLNTSRIEALQAACQQAWAGAPNAKRLQLQWLRVSAALGKPSQQWLLVPQVKMLADQGSAEAQYLMFHFFKLHPDENDPPTPFVTRDEALAYLKKAAEQGHLDALMMLATQYHDGPLLRRDQHAAVKMARRVESAPPQGIAETKYESNAHQYFGLYAAETTLEDDSFSPAEQRIAFAAVDKASKSGTSDDFVSHSYITALRYGRGTAKDPLKARKLLEAHIANDQYAVPYYAGMLAHGEGGPADLKRALALLRDEKMKYTAGAAGVLADILLDGKLVGRQPQEAIQALGRSWRLEDMVRLASLLIDYQARIETHDRLIETLTDAAAAGETDAALALARLKLSDNSDFKDLDGARVLLKPLTDAGNREALWLYAGSQYANLDSSSFPPDPQPGGLSDDDLKNLIAEGMQKKEAEAFLLKAKLLRKGMVYPQDDQAATNDLINAANLGNVDAMRLLGNAYSDGLGTPKNDRERLHAWREAAKHGSLKAQRNLANAFIFDTFNKLMTLDEGVTTPLVLYINSDDGTPSPMGIDTVATVQLGSMFTFGSRAMEAGTPAVADAVMKAFRVAPAGLKDSTLISIGKALPDEIKAAIAMKLKTEGFYSGQPNSYFGPEVRQALVAWVDAKGPVETATDSGNQTQPRAQNSELVSPEIVNRVRASMLKQSKAAKTKRQKLSAISGINALAQLGDINSRWALVNNYHQVDVVRKVVSPAELTRYALDIMATKPEGADKPEFALIFDVTQIQQDGDIDTFGKATLDAIRDDPRLQDPLTLGGILQQFVFAPGACDAMLTAGRKARIASLGEDGCDETTLSALIAFAKQKGPAGVDQAARKAAVTDVKALDEEAAK